eukprot:GHVT01040128.1.p1 GENE.GHVT01040128.1~~GHVT01040128.1.p1  ORF type:complete len:420 (-),score=17.42 GHVT01040128.1:510-1769(-)
MSWPLCWCVFHPHGLSSATCPAQRRRSGLAALQIVVDHWRASGTPEIKRFSVRAIQFRKQFEVTSEELSSRRGLWPSYRRAVPLPTPISTAPLNRCSSAPTQLTRSRGKLDNRKYLLLGSEQDIGERIQLRVAPWALLLGARPPVCSSGALLLLRSSAAHHREARPSANSGADVVICTESISASKDSLVGFLAGSEAIPDFVPSTAAVAIDIRSYNRHVESRRVGTCSAVSQSIIDPPIVCLLHRAPARCFRRLDSEVCTPETAGCCVDAYAPFFGVHLGEVNNRTALPTPAKMWRGIVEPYQYPLQPWLFSKSEPSSSVRNVNGHTARWINTLNRRKFKVRRMHKKKYKKLNMRKHKLPINWGMFKNKRDSRTWRFYREWKRWRIDRFHRTGNKGCGIRKIYAPQQRYPAVGGWRILK